MQAWNAAEHTHAVTVQALPQLLAREHQNHAAQAIQLAHDVAVPADACCLAARLQEGGYSVDDAGPARHDSRPEGGRSAAAALGLAGTLCPAEQPTPTGLCAPTLYVCVWWVGGWRARMATNSKPRAGVCSATRLSACVCSLLDQRAARLRDALARTRKALAGFGPEAVIALGVPPACAHA